jgi:hypothetical protein
LRWRSYISKIAILVLPPGWKLGQLKIPPPGGLEKIGSAFNSFKE